MKKVISVIALAAFASGCSAPKYAYRFDTHKYYPGKPASQVVVEPATELPTVQPEYLTASTERIVIVPENAITAGPAAKTYAKMNKVERKAVRQYVKNEIAKSAPKKYEPAKVQATQGLDKDLKLAAIFGAVGIVGLLIAGDVFYIIGGIALLIGVVFFVKWIIRQ